MVARKGIGILRTKSCVVTGKTKRIYGVLNYEIKAIKGKYKGKRFWMPRIYI